MVSVLQKTRTLRGIRNTDIIAYIEVGTMMMTSVCIPFCVYVGRMHYPINVGEGAIVFEWMGLVFECATAITNAAKTLCVTYEVGEQSVVVASMETFPCAEQGMADDTLARSLATVTGAMMTDEEAATDVAFRTAAVMGFREAALAATPELLEPIMSLDIVTPADHVGDIMGDINGRRGSVRDMTTRGDMQIVRAQVPLAELFGYSTAIRSLSRGRASYTMEPGEFAVVPRTVREQLLNR